MHIDQPKFVELLAEASGIDAEKVEQQLGELAEEIRQAIADDEAYEIEDFGIFSGIGNRIMFIPSKELETEINFKYAGMEPLEVDEDVVAADEQEDDEDPFEGLQMADDDSSSEGRDPFSGLVVEDDEEEEEKVPPPKTSGDYSDEDIFGDIDDLDEEETETPEEEPAIEGDDEEEEQPGPDEWGVEAHKETGVNRLFSSLMGEEAPEDDEPVEETEEEAVNDVEEELSGEAAIEPEEEDSFADIFGDDDDEPTVAEKENEEEVESVSGLDAELSDIMSDDSEVIKPEELEAGMTEESTKASPFASLGLDEPFDDSDDDEDDFDDPFDAIEEDDEEEPEEIIPVITNISSDIEPKPKEEKEKKEKKKKPKKDPQPVSVWLLIVVALVVITGAVFGLAYFKILNIPGITPQVATSQPVVKPPVQQQQTNPTPPPTDPEPAAVEGQPQETQTKEAVQEQAPATQVPVNADQPKYGLMGIATEVANDGYTIVVYSLSVQKNATVKQKELAEKGYRALVTPIPSQQYGTLWRVSIGQFGSLVDAAIAGEELENPFKENYFIKKIK